MSEILKNIIQRRSLRVPFDINRQIPEPDLGKILESARWTPTAHNMQNFDIIVVNEKKKLQFIFEIKRPISETFIRENYHQLSSSEDELKMRKTGILGNMFPPSWRKPDFKLSDIDEKEIAMMQRPLPPAPLMLVVTYDPGKRAPASEGDFLGIISLGCVMENMWLMAETLGIGFHIISSLSAEGVETGVKDILGIPEHLRIAFTCRLGYPVTAPQNQTRVRRNIADFVHYNKW